MCEFRIGQKVVCVDAKERTGFVWLRDAPAHGAVYTITGILIGPDPATNKPIALLQFAEIRQHPQLVGYGYWRFRPLVERTYDISIFQNMCIDSRQTTGAAVR